MDYTNTDRCGTLITDFKLYEVLYDNAEVPTLQEELDAKFFYFEMFDKVWEQATPHERQAWGSLTIERYTKLYVSRWKLGEDLPPGEVTSGAKHRMIFNWAFLGY